MGENLLNMVVTASKRRLLTLASLFEGFFSIDWLLELTGLKVAEILSSVEDGIAQGLIIQIEPGKYRFKNDEDRNQLKETLDRGERKRSNQAIIDILLKEPVDDDETITLVATHLLNIKNGIEGCRRLVKAGMIHVEMNRFKKAKPYIIKVLDDLKNNDDEEADELFIRSAIGYSYFSEPDSHIAPVTDALHAAMKRARKRDHKPWMGILEMHLGKTDYFLGNMNSALRHLHRGWDIIEELNEPMLKQTATEYSTLLLYGQGRYVQVISNYEEFAPEVAKHPKTRLSALATIYTGCAYGLTGKVTQGMGLLDTLSTHYADKGDAFVDGLLSFGIGVILLELNRVDEAMKHLKRSKVKTSKASSDIYLGYSYQYLAEAYNRLNEQEKCIACLKQCLELSDKMKMVPNHLFNLIELCWKLEEAGQSPDFLKLPIDKLINSTVRGKHICAKGMAYRCQGLLRRKAKEDHENIIQSYNLSIKWLTASGHQTELAKTYIELIRQYLLIDDETRAGKAMQKLGPILDTYGDYLLPEDLMFLRRDRQDDKGLLKKIMKLGQDLVVIRDNRELAGHILSTANSITGAERGAIFLLDKEASTQKPVLRAAKNLTTDDIDHPDFAAQMSLIEKTFTTETGQIQKRAPTKKQTSQNIIVRDCICVPMKIRDTVVGVLYHDNRFFRSNFEESDLEILSFFAAQAAIAMDNAEAYEALEQENRYYEAQQFENFQFDEIVGESQAIKNVLQKVVQVAATDSNVLILGETGVGKELVARAIYQRSDRSDQPFIRTNCSAFPDTLITSELFGHEKGAFTGARDRRMGRFELADKGIIFLDEIGDISMDVQLRLLRVIQTREFERLGGSKTVQSDFRLIAATNRDLYEDVKENRFREDLYYRLNVFPIHVPPLRERKADIALLAYYFLKIYEKKFRKQVKKISQADMARLIDYDWPGNIRELENVIERGVILSHGPRFKLPESSHKHTTTDQKGRIETLRELERAHIIRALKATGGKIQGKGSASDILDIHPNTLYGRMKKLGINRET
ncbi:MAG: sigma 54-interacting transcriptional regulator [Deltaproteobacteria bacterium]|nr:sigma 54-interacting transcriptional regulator [Deltaproteobacteria bacterium]